MTKPVDGAEALAKTASVGTVMYRRSDVLSAINRAKRHAVNAVALAQEQDRHEDAALCAVRLRTIRSIIDDVKTRTPQFENAATVAARTALETRNG